MGLNDLGGVYALVWLLSVCNPTVIQFFNNLVYANQS